LRGSLTIGAIRAAFRSPLIHTLRVIEKPGCVGVGWRYIAEIDRNAAEIDVRAATWKTEEALIEYVRAFFGSGPVSASRLLK
jgi:hypothetical protein